MFTHIDSHRLLFGLGMRSGGDFVERGRHLGPIARRRGNEFSRAVYAGRPLDFWEAEEDLRKAISNRISGYVSS